MPKKIQAYGCDHCGMTSLRRYSVVRHEINACRSSPDRKSCATCKHLDIDTVGDENVSFDDLYCSVESDCFQENQVFFNTNNDCPDFIHKLGSK